MQKAVWASTSQCHPGNWLPSGPHKAAPPAAQPAGDKTCTLNRVWAQVTLGPGVPVGPRLGVHASPGAYRDTRAGQGRVVVRTGVSGREWVTLGLEEWREKV